MNQLNTPLDRYVRSPPLEHVFWGPLTENHQKGPLGLLKTVWRPMEALNNYGCQIEVKQLLSLLKVGCPSKLI